LAELHAFVGIYAPDVDALAAHFGGKHTLAGAGAQLPFAVSVLRRDERRIRAAAEKEHVDEAPKILAPHTEKQLLEAVLSDEGDRESGGSDLEGPLAKLVECTGSVANHGPIGLHREPVRRGDE
jgi:hypothetical protein